MERNSQPTGLVNVIISLVAAAVGIYISRQTASVSDEVVSAFLGLGFLVTLFSYFQMRMEAREPQTVRSCRSAMRTGMAQHMHTTANGR